MKSLLLFALLGLTGLCPYTMSARPVFEKYIVTSNIEGWNYIVTSDETSGTISEIRIFDSNTLTQVKYVACSGYVCSIDIQSLPKGLYTARVVTQHSTYSSQFMR
jgi:hypothetical protein